MGKAWKTFKSTLVTEYVNKDRTPFMKYHFMSPDIWDAFVWVKTTAEFQQQSAAYKAIQTQNRHPHRLVTARYTGKILQWRREDKEAIQWEASPPFARIIDERARNWLRASHQPRLQTPSL